MLVLRLVGDLTQPLHCSARRRRGARQLRRPEGTPGLHHRACRLGRGAHRHRTYDWGAFAAGIEADVMPALEPTTMDAGDFEEWANDCHRAGIDAYAILPAPVGRNDGIHAPLPLGKDYGDATSSCSASNS